MFQARGWDRIICFDQSWRAEDLPQKAQAGRTGQKFLIFVIAWPAIRLGPFFRHYRRGTCGRWL